MSPLRRSVSAANKWNPNVPSTSLLSGLHLGASRPRQGNPCSSLIIRQAGNDDSDVDDQDSFDGKGFAGYLAPYAIAFLAALGATAAFVKFVLLDY